MLRYTFEKNDDMQRNTLDEKFRTHHYQSLKIRNTMPQMIDRNTSCIKANRFVGVAVMIVISILAVQTNTSLAQTGAIGGIVTNDESEKPLHAATIILEGSDKKTVTDKFGRFTLSRVPVGLHLIKVDLLGYESQEIPVSVSAGSTQIQHIRLVFEADDGDRIFVKKHREGIAQAIAGQIQTPKFGYVVTADQMDQAGDYTVESGMARMPGVQVGRRGELNIRGAGRNRFDVLIDGQRMPTMTNSRGVDLGGISAEMAQHVEVINVPTPDMEVEGVGGIVHINTWRPVGERELNVRASGMTNLRYIRFTGLGNMASVNYSERFSDNFSMAANLTYQQETQGYESLGINYGTARIENEVVDVIEQLSPGLNSNVRNRFGGRLQMSYQLDAQTTYYFRGLLNTDNFENERHRNVSIANGDWIDQTTTGSVGEQGRFTYNPFLRKEDNFYSVIQAGGRHMLDFMNVEYRAGWAHSNIDQNQFDFLFTRNRLDYTVNMDDRTRPEMIISNLRLMEDGTLESRALDFDSVERIRDGLDEDRYSARLDFEVPLGPVSLKTGGSGHLTERIRSYEEADLATLRRYNLLRFRKLPRSSFEVLDQYFFREVIQVGDAARFVDISRPEMRLDEDDMFQRSLIWNYDASEYIYAGYGMATLELNRFTLLGGVRIEQTDATYDGHRVVFSRFDVFESSVDTSRSVSYTNILPNVQFIFSPTRYSNIKLAWSKSLKRQDYHQLAPFELINAADTTLFKGNPDLKPVTSENLDLMYKHALRDVGALTIGLFYKELSNNKVLLQEKTVSQSEFPDLTVDDGETIEVKERTFINSNDEISLYGFEVSWQQYLHFLPGFLGNFGVNANYAWTQSTNENRQNGRDVALRHLSPHVVNAAIEYNQSRFSGQIAWHWTAAALYREASDVRWAPALNRSEQIYLDLYEEGWMDLSAFFGFRISEKFRFWAHVSNLLPTVRVRYGESRDLYPFDSELRDGSRISAGLRYTL